MNAATHEGPSLRRAELCLATKYVAPDCETGRALVNIWQDVLDVDQVGLDDDFFEIGGDSLGATIIAGNIESRFGCRFSPSQLVEANTVGKQLEVIQAEKKDSEGEAELDVPSHMTLFNAKGKKPALFLIHGGRGMSLHDRRFLEGLDPAQPVIFVDAIGFDGKERTPKTVEETASRYLEGVLEIAPEGPILLAASCSGSLVILEMARQLQKVNRPAERVLMMDPHVKWFGDPSLSGIKALRKTISHKHCAEIRFRLRRLKLKLGMGNVGEFERSFTQKSQDMKVIQKRMRKSAENGAEGSMAAVDLQAEAILETQETYYRAVRDYQPKPWDGEVHVLITKSRESGISRIKGILPRAKFRVTEYNHSELFREGAKVALKFLEDAQYRKDEPGMFP